MTALKFQTEGETSDISGLPLGKAYAYGLQVSCSRISSSEDIRKTYFAYMTFHSDLDKSKPILLKDTLTIDDAPSYQVS